MSLGERIKTIRQKAGMSQEKVAELIGVSRQAVTKWEANQSAPNTENLFKLAEIFETTVDMLLTPADKTENSTAEQIYHLYKIDKEKNAALKKRMLKRNALNGSIILIGYLSIYLIGRIIWCDLSQSNLIGWLFSARPVGEHSYLYGWLLTSNLFWCSMAISALPALLGKHVFSYTTLIGFLIGLVSGIIFGPYPEGAAIGQGHYGWAIWGVIFFISIAAGIIIEIFKKKSEIKQTDQ